MERTEADPVLRGLLAKAEGRKRDFDMYRQLARQAESAGNAPDLAQARGMLMRAYRELSACGEAVAARRRELGR